MQAWTCNEGTYEKGIKEGTAWKVSKYRVISGLYLVNLHIQSKYRNIWTRNNTIFRHFSHSEAGGKDIKGKLISIVNTCFD